MKAIKRVKRTGRGKPEALTEFRGRLRDARTALLHTAATLSRLKDQERQELAEIEAAEARLDRGVFGACAACGKALSLTRLRALPTARLCLRCRAREEADGGE